MPIYEYQCHQCHRRVSLLWRTMSAAVEGQPVCPRCGSTQLSRLDNLADPSSLGDVDENDPKSLARWMRKMSGEMGEDLGDEFREVVDRLEAGEDPEEIEKTMPDLAGAGGGGGDDFGVMD